MTMKTGEQMYCPWVDAGARYAAIYIGQGDIEPARAAWLPRHKVILLARTLTRVQGRCALAHELAHIDLQHRPDVAGRYGRWQEREADWLAARRLIPLPVLADALVWCRDDRALAEELDVVPELVDLRRTHLSQEELDCLREMVERFEEAA